MGNEMDSHFFVLLIFHSLRVLLSFECGNEFLNGLIQNLCWRLSVAVKELYTNIQVRSAVRYHSALIAGVATAL